MALVAVVVGSVDVVDHDVVVHVADVTRAVLIGGAKSLAGRQREPAQAGPRGLLADGHIPVHAAGVAADEGNQRWRVHRPRGQLPGHPAPARADLRPAAVMEGCKAPGRVIYPGPAPGRYPAPVAGAVGRPVDRHGARHPHGAVGRVLAPVAVVVELLVADHFTRHVARRHRLVFQPVALVRPGIEAILHFGRRACGCQLRVGEVGLLPGNNIDLRAAVTVNRAGTLLHHDARGAGSQVARRVGAANVHAVVARLGDHKRQVGRVDLDALAVKQIAHPQLHRALGQAQLGGVVVQFQKIKAGLLAQAHGSRSDMQLGPRALASPEPVASGQRPVQRGGRPARVAACIGRSETDRAFGQVHAGDTAWRVDESGLLAELLRHLRPHRQRRKKCGDGECGQHRQSG